VAGPSDGETEVAKGGFPAGHIKKKNPVHIYHNVLCLLSG